MAPCPAEDRFAGGEATASHPFVIHPLLGDDEGAGKGPLAGHVTAIGIEPFRAPSTRGHGSLVLGNRVYGQNRRRLLMQPPPLLSRRCRRRRGREFLSQHCWIWK